MPTPKISVIIPFYGVEKYIDKCLLSVRNQTFKDIEIICIDDCSPDNSYKIVEKHIKKDKRIKLIRHEKNLGLGGARNTAIRAAKSEYLASVDSDDYMSPTMLETLWNATENGWFDIVCCGYNQVDEESNILKVIKPIPKEVVNDNNDIDIFTLLSFPAFWGKLWRRSLFIENNIFFPNHDFYEDMSTTPRILSKARYIKVIEDNLYQYLIRDESIMSSFSDKHIIDYLKGFEILSEYLERNKLQERYEFEFNHYIQGHIFYYAKLILTANVPVDKKKQYLRFLVLFRVTFSENYSYFKWHDIDGLIVLLREENLHGTFYQKYKKTKNLVERHWTEIETKAKKISAMNMIIHDFKNVVYETRSKLEDEKKTKEEYSSIISQLQEKKKRYANELSKTKNDLKVAWDILALKEEQISSLEEELSEKVSLSQMFAVYIFALFTYFFMSENHTIKLINKPKKFFRDSKSNFAKKYASLFKII